MGWTLHYDAFSAGGYAVKSGVIVRARNGEELTEVIRLHEKDKRDYFANK